MRLAGVVGAVVGIGLFAPQALAVDNGSFFLKSKEARLIVVGTTARELRICNDVASGGAIGFTLGSPGLLVLQPGNCADDMADRILATIRGGATAMGTWRTYYAPDDRHMPPDDPHQQVPSVGTQAFGQQRDVDFFLNATSAMRVPQVMIPVTGKVGTAELATVNTAVRGLPPNTGFDLFSIEVPNAPFGLAWYIGDIVTDSQGIGVGNFVGRFNIETFVISP